MNDTSKFFEEFEIPTYEDWKSAATAALKGADFDKKMFTQTYEGITLKPIYNKEDVENLEHINGLPGVAPFGRSTKPNGFKQEGWYINQRLPFFLPADYNSAAKVEIEGGQNALNIKADTIWNIDSNNPMFKLHKLNIMTLEQLEIAFKDIDIRSLALFFDGSEISYVYAALIYAYCNANNIPLKDLNLFLGIDPITIMARKGRAYTSPAKYYDQAAELINWNTANSIRSRVFSVNSSVFHNSGGSAIHEIAGAIATGTKYLREMLNRGIDVNTVANSIWFNFSMGTQFFMGIAKLRTARMLWAKVVKEFGGDEEAQKMFINASTSWRDNTKYDPYVNLLRNSSETFAAILGSSDSIDVTHFDNKHGVPDEFSRRVARNTQNVLKYEAHLNDTIDPTGGSYYVETLTGQLAEKSWNYFKNIEKEGGMYEFLQKDIMQKDITEIAELRDKNLSTRKDVILGTNKYPNIAEKPASTEIFHEEVIEKYIRLARSKYSKKVVTAKTFQEIVDEFATGTYVNDIVNALFQGDTPVKIPVIGSRRSAKLFENMRDASKKYKEKNRRIPVVHLACYGTLNQYKTRADFAADFFQVAGLNTEVVDGFLATEELIEGIKKTDAKVIVFCSTDDFYAEFLTKALPAIKKEKPRAMYILAGYPTDKVEEYKAAGIDDFIYFKANVYEIVNKVQKFLFK
ncbi:MAG: methylmalonyl-CoA mutase family protein [bacterium]